MRFNFRIKLGRIKVFAMLSKTQTLEGVTSKVVTEPEEKHLHYIFWDLEGCSLQEAIETLAEVQYEFKLGDIFIISDCEGSYRAWCFSKRPWLIYMHILLHTNHVDWNFIYWTVKRHAATLRISNKVNRPPQELVSVLKGYEQTMIPEKLCHVHYDTGIEKRGRLIQLG